MGDGGKLNGGNMVQRVWQEAAGLGVWVVIRKKVKCYVGSWLGGFEWPIFVGVDALAYDKTGS